MNKKQTKRQRDIKNKLMAAICMLLVSSIMMVSSTYAWFTLSTAPEVTGIQTAVGSNGNLEMALLPETVDLTKLDEQITSAEGDSMEAANKLVTDANITWGNLVDVSSPAYGLSHIVLNPAALNTADVKVGENVVLGLGNSLLQTPAYGSDGRVTELKGNTITGVYNGSVFQGESTASSYGVRAVGTSSSMSERQLAHRDALSAAARAGSQAITEASQSLKNRGNILANVAIRHATKEKSEAEMIYTKAEVEAMLAAVNDLETAIGHIETAIKQYVVANSIADATDTEYVALKDAILAADVYNLSAVTNVDIPEVLTGTNGHIAKLAATKAKVTSAKTGLSGLLPEDTTATHFAWKDFSTHLGVLVESSAMTINGVKVSELTKSEVADGETVYPNMNHLVSSVLGGQGLTLTLSQGAGVFADIADFCGDYSAKINIDQIEYQGLQVRDVEAKMLADGIETTYLDSTRTGTAAFKSGNSTSASNPISGYYGYVIDLAFRTNAADSFLQLQTDAVDRVYEGNTANEDTLGGGSSMTFTPANGFETTAMEKLMESIRLVFFDPATKEIIGYARLDKTTSTPTTDGGITMKLKMVDAAGNKKETTTGEGASAVTEEDPTIVALEQNKAKAVSVLVYLDGHNVTNADVANAAQSMSGTMNLQFSSSATLTPMQYSDLMTGDSDNNVNARPQVTQIRPTVDGTATGVTSSPVAISGTTMGFALTGYNSADHDIVVTYNDNVPLTVTEVAGQNGAFTGTLPADTTVTSVKITVNNKTA